jgi:tetratricopeptide (TPR) repeat protein
LLTDIGYFEESRQRYEKALEIYENLLKKDPENIMYQFEYGMTLNNLGTLHWNIGQTEEAKYWYEKAIKTNEILLKKDPKNVMFLSNLGMELSNLGVLYKNICQFEKARNSYVKALELREKLLKIDPENVQYQLNLGMTLNNFGVFLSKIGHIQRARRIFIKAYNIYDSLLMTNPENVEYQSNIGGILNNLGIFFRDIECYDESKQCIEKALEIHEYLLKEVPDNVTYQLGYVHILHNLSIPFLGKGHIEEARQKYEKALEIYENFLKKDPENQTYELYLGQTLNNFGDLLSHMGHIEEAKRSYKKALDIYTEPMQYRTVSAKSQSIIRLIELSSGQARKETNFLNQIEYLKETFNLCKEYREFFSKHKLNYERELVFEAGLKAYIDFLMKKLKLETDSKKRSEEYNKSLHAIERLKEMEADETISKLYSSAIFYLMGRKLVNEALASRNPELELLRQAVEHFRMARETYDNANMCYCIYFGLLSILKEVEEFEEVDYTKLNELIQKVVITLPEDVSPSIRSSFEDIPQIFKEKNKISRKELIRKLDYEISAIEYKVQENIFGHINERIKDYFEEPFSPNLFYGNWKLKVKFDDPEKIKGKLIIKAGNRTLFNRNLSKNEIEQNLIEIDYLKVSYFPKGPEEISFTILGHKKLIKRSIDYFESIVGENKIRIFHIDCSDNFCINQDLKIAAVQLRYHIYSENSVVKLATYETYYCKVMAILDALKDEADIVVFPEFSIPFEYLKEMKQYVENTGIIVIAGSHYVTEKILEKYEELFSRKFVDEDLRKNISPILVPSSKILHNEKLLGAREERELFFTAGMKAGNVNNIFKLQDNIRLGIMICYEYLNTNLRNRLVSACDVVIVPQTNPKPERFFETAKNDINNPLCSGNRAYIMANGIFSVQDEKTVQGGSTGIVSTLDRYSYEKQDEGIIKPIGGVMEQFILLTSINKDFNHAKDTQIGQVPIKTKLIHIFEENEVTSVSRSYGKGFIELLKTIDKCGERNELRDILTNKQNKKIIKTFSPLMHKYIQDLEELTLDEIKKKCRFIMIPTKS